MSQFTNPFEKVRPRVGRLSCSGIRVRVDIDINVQVVFVVLSRIHSWRFENFIRNTAKKRVATDGGESETGERWVRLARVSHDDGCVGSVKSR